MSQEEIGLWTWGWNIIIALVPLLFILWFIYSIKKQNKQKLPLPPGPRGLPLVGYLPFLGSNLHTNFIELASKYGPIFKVQLGIKNWVVITSPSLAKEVLRDQDATFANRGDPSVAARSLFSSRTLDIAFSDYGPEWRKMRKVFVGDMLSNAQLDASYFLRKQNVNKMVYETYSKAGQVVDVGELGFVTIVGSVMSMIWGDTLKGDENISIDAEFRAVTTEEMELLGAPNVSDLFPLLARFDLQGIERRMKMVSGRYEKMLDSAINHHSTGEISKRKDFLGHLLQLTKLKDPVSSLTLPQVKAILTDIVIGGTDTTAAMIEWVMAELLQHPKELKKVQQELTESVGLNSAAEEAHLPKLKYLNAVVKETLRLHPSVPMLVPHCPSKASTVGGYTIPEGTHVYINAYAIQRDPQLWENPLQFQPERFLSGYSADKVEYIGNHFQYIPFGSGRRVCPGIPLAERISMLVLASLLHGFNWNLPNGSVEVDMSERFGIVVKKAEPLLLVPSPRLSSLELYSYND